jgi:hypothetical protein
VIPEAATRTQIILARAVVVAMAVLIVLGLVMYGSSAEVRSRIWKDIFDRPGGPMTFRFILQPCMAAIAAFADGIKDARLGRDPYLWTILTNAQESAGRMREGLIATARIILLGLGMDAIYQATVLKTFYPGEMALVAILLAFVPYLLLRGPFTRIARWWFARKSADSAG